MKESNWNECLINKSAKTIMPEIIRAKSLVETSKERISVIKEINEKIVIMYLRITIFQH
jgi:hypothetical protein